MLERALAFAVARHGLPFAKQLVLVNGEPFEPHGPASMQFPGADPDLGAQSVTEPIRKSRGSILKNIGRVHELHEPRRHIMALGPDGLRMPRAISIDMFNRFVDAVHDLDGN